MQYGDGDCELSGAGDSLPDPVCYSEVSLGLAGLSLLTTDCTEGERQRVQDRNTDQLRHHPGDSVLTRIWNKGRLK